MPQHQSPEIATDSYNITYHTVQQNHEAPRPQMMYPTSCIVLAERIPINRTQHQAYQKEEDTCTVEPPQDSSAVVQSDTGTVYMYSKRNLLEIFSNFRVEVLASRKGQYVLYIKWEH